VHHLGGAGDGGEPAGMGQTGDNGEDGEFVVKGIGRKSIHHNPKRAGAGWQLILSSI
jgi:hypothetical protein